MIQRIAVRLLLEHRGRLLVLRRADGRESILGKYELPGGRVMAGEQPEDALRRYLRDDLGVADDMTLSLNDALTYTDADDRGIQYAIFLYKAVLHDATRAFSLSSHYDKYVWYHADRFDAEKLTDLSRIILGVERASAKASFTDDSVSQAKCLIYTDGGSRGNPGPSATGFVLVNSAGDVVEQGGRFIGNTTNNQAEYQAVQMGMKAALARRWRIAECRIDSLLVVNQLNGLYKIKNPELEPLYQRVKEVAAQFEKIKFVHIPREQNRLADGMVNKVLDEAERNGYNHR